MSKELSNIANSLPSKAITTAYVHDMAEIEAREFTLRKTKKELLQRAEKMQQDADKELESADFRVACAIKDREKAASKFSLNHYPTKEAMDKKGCVTAGFRLFLPCYICVYLVIILLAYLEIISISVDSESTYTIVAAVAFVLTLILSPILGRISAKSRYKADLSIYRKTELKIAEEVNKAEKNIDSMKENYTQAQIKYNNTQKSIAFIKQQAQDAGKKADEIAKIKQNLYSLGIVPPDYREMDCVIMFDQIFRNDLADTMREAVKIYEERVFRGEVIRGIENIYNRLGKLAATMSSIETRLYGIHKDVVSISDDLYAFSQQADKMCEQQKELLNETKYNRYANEAVAESAKKIEKYVNNK